MVVNRSGRDGRLKNKEAGDGKGKEEDRQEEDPPHAQEQEVG